MFTLKRVLDEYRPFVGKMVVDKETILATCENLEKLLDLETFLGLSCNLPLYELVHIMLRCAQAREYHVVDFILSIGTLPNQSIWNVCGHKSCI